MPKLKKLRIYLGLSIVSLFLSGCAAPTAYQIISLAIDGISYLATDKSIADHGLSAIAQRDCRMFRTLTEKTLAYEEICKDEKPDEEVLEEALIDPEQPSVPAVQ